MLRPAIRTFRLPPRVPPEQVGELGRLRADRNLAIQIAESALDLADSAGCGPMSTSRLRALLKQLAGLLLIAMMISACGGWSKKDTALELALVPALYVDYDQTIGIQKDGDEANPIMGEHGERVPRQVYFPCYFLVHAAIAAALPRGWWRTSWQAITIGLEGETVKDNYTHGWGF